MAVVVGVGAWAAKVTAQAAEELSINALRSAELAAEMRWQIARLTPGPAAAGPIPMDPGSAQALLRLGRDVRASERLVTSDAGRREWARLSMLSRALADAWSRGDGVAASWMAESASESADRLIALNHAEADALGRSMVDLGRSQVVINTLAAAVAFLAFAQLARARLRSLERERVAIARTLETVEDKNRELEAFAGRVAHDLRAPLTPVQALAGLLVRGGQGEGDVRRVAGKIVASTSRMSDLIEAMLTFSRSGRPPAGDCAVASVVAEVLDELHPESDGTELRGRAARCPRGLRAGGARADHPEPRRERPEVPLRANGPPGYRSPAPSDWPDADPGAWRTTGSGWAPGRCAARSSRSSGRAANGPGMVSGWQSWTVTCGRWAARSR